MGFFSAAMGLTQAFTGVVGAYEQLSVDKERTRLSYQDNLEKIRRRDFSQRQTLGTSKARSQASGVLHTGGSSAQGGIDTMTREFKYELDWMKRYAERGLKLGLQSADIDWTKNVMTSLSEGMQTMSSGFA